MPIIAATDFGLLPTLRRKEDNGYQRKNGARIKTLLGHLRLLPTLLRRDGGSFLKTKRGKNSQGGDPLPQVLGGQIHPAFAEWFMGYPIGWTALVRWATRSSRKSPTKSCGTCGR